MRTLALALLLGACTPNELTVTPQRIAWEEIDFQQARPDGGYLPQEISVRNDGSRALDVEIVGFDEEHLLLGALLASEEPPTLPTLEPGSQHVLTVAVWDYLAGERDSLVEGAFDLVAPGVKEPVTIEWSFTPVREIVVDTSR